MIRLIAILILNLNLFGCSFLFGDGGLFPDTTETYQSASELRPLDVPSHLSTKSLQSDYLVPEVAVSAQSGTNFKTPRPTPLTAANQVDAVRIQSLSDERWALVNIAPGQLWPQVRAFLSAGGIGVAAVDAQRGLIDTQWFKLENRELAVRFRYRVDTGVQRNTAELHVLQQDKNGENIDWPRTSDDYDLEKEMLRDMAQYLANSTDAVPISMMADQSMSDSGRIVLEEIEERTFIRLKLSFARAWASTIKGAEDAGFVIEDRDRSQGQLYVVFVGPKEEQDDGWLDWLWGEEDNHPLSDRSYQIRIDESDVEEVLITLLGSDGGSIDKLEQQALLTILLGNIS